MEIGFIFIILVILIGGWIMIDKIKKIGEKSKGFFNNKFLKNTNKDNEIPPLISEDDEYIGNKWLIENAIKEKDWDRLNAMLKEDDIIKHDKFINMIKNALKNK